MYVYGEKQQPKRNDVRDRAWNVEIAWYSGKKARRRS